MFPREKPPHQIFPSLILKNSGPRELPHPLSLISNTAYMKIAQHFRAFLERHHYLQLPQIGRFEVVGEAPAENGYTRKWINFSPDTSQATDPELITFISNNMRVESSITTSDLFCFISSLKEMLIQGFEVEIPNIGYLHFEPSNILKFSGKNLYKNPIQKRWKRNIPAAMSQSFWL